MACCWSICSKPSCSPRPCMAVESGPQLIQQLARLRSSSPCSIPCSAVHAVSKAVSPSIWLMTPTKTRAHKPMLAEWTSEFLSLSPLRLSFVSLLRPGGMIFGGIESSGSGMQWFKLNQQQSATLSCMLPLPLLSMGAALAGLHKFSGALLSMASPAHR